MQTVFTTNNGYDAILLVDGSDTVVSAWPVTDANLANYLRDGANVDDWEVGHWEGFDGDEIAIGDYGDEAGRNGTLSAKRGEFYAHKFERDFPKILRKLMAPKSK